MTLRCDTLEALLSLHELGELDDPTRDEVAVHLEVCEPCRGVLEGYRALSELCRQEEPPRLSAKAGGRVLGRLHQELARDEGAARRELAPEIMTMEEAARYLRVAVEDLEGELEQLPCFEFAGKLRIRKVALDRWIEERERTSRRRRLLSVVEGGS